MQFSCRVLWIAIAVVYIAVLGVQAKNLEDVYWKLAYPLESQFDTCSRNGLVPYQHLDGDFSWNSTVFNIAVSQLGLTVVPNTQDGLLGCCASSMWCGTQGCFTQNFGSTYDNFGWIRNDSVSFPVYTCISTTSSSVSFSNITVQNDQALVRIQGIGTFPESSLPSSQVYGHSCYNSQLCQCQTCSTSADCPIGMGCKREKGSSGSYCYRYCMGSTDTSCPCDQSCVLDSALSTYICSSTATTCKPGASSYNSTVTCEPRGLLQQLSYTTLNVSVAVEGGGGSISQTSADPVYFCTSDSDCIDGNSCTTDLCIEGTCSNIPLDSSCQSMQSELVQQTATYTYISADLNSLNAAPAFDTLWALWYRSSTRAYSTAVTVALSDSLLFMGNTVKAFSLSLYGVAWFPPTYYGCTGGQSCGYFSSYTNAIGLQYLTDSSYDTLRVAFEDDVAAHVLMQAPGSALVMSLFFDGSVRIVSNSSRNSSSSSSDDSGAFTGLWGSYVSSSINRYHLEHASSDNNSSSSSSSDSGSSWAFCPTNTTACAPQSCVVAGNNVTLYSNVSSPLSCQAVSNSSSTGGVFALQCAWLAGLVYTTASIVDAYTNARPYSKIECAVPTLDIGYNNSLLTVNLVHTLDGMVIDTAQLNSAKSTRGITYDETTGEIGRGSLFVRYYSTEPTSWASTDCGCNALIVPTGNDSSIEDSGMYTCQVNGICSSTSALPSSVNDCANVPFGSAYLDACGVCSSGYTGRTPAIHSSQCPSSGSSNNDLVVNILTQTIILLMIICCLTFLTSAISYSLRRILMRRQTQAMMLENEMVLQMLAAEGLAADGRGSQRGLTPIEIEALGQVVCTIQFLEQYKREKHAADKKSASNTPTVPESALTTTTTSELGSMSPTTPSVAEAETVECPICLVEIEEGNTIRALPEPCGHLFHVACIDPWFQQSQACPLCKRSMRSILLGSYEEEVVAQQRREEAQHMQHQHRSRSYRIRSGGNSNNSSSRVSNNNDDDLYYYSTGNGHSNGSSNGNGSNRRMVGGQRSMHFAPPSSSSSSALPSSSTQEAYAAAYGGPQFQQQEIGELAFASIRSDLQQAQQQPSVDMYGRPINTGANPAYMYYTYGNSNGTQAMPNYPPQQQYQHVGDDDRLLWHPGALSPAGHYYAAVGQQQGYDARGATAAPQQPTPPSQQQQQQQQQGPTNGNGRVYSV